MLRGLKISYKVGLSFLVTAILALTSITAVSYARARSLVLDQKTTELRNVAKLKVGTIRRFFESVDADVELVQQSGLIQEYMPLVAALVDERNDEDYEQAIADLDGMLIPLRSGGGYLEVVVLDSQDRLVYTTGSLLQKSGLGQEPGSITDKLESGVVEGVELSRAYLGEKKGDIELLAYGSLVNDRGEELGKVVVVVDLAPVFELVDDKTDLGNTGETLVGRRMESHPGEVVAGHAVEGSGEHVVYLNTPRYRPGGAFRETVFLGDGYGTAMQEAALGKEGAGVRVDYRGKEVVAAWTYIEEANWGVVAKMDIGEAMAFVKVFRDQVLMFAGFAGVMLLMISFLVTTQISRPISELAEAADQIREGNLGVKIKTGRKDEIGRLAKALSRMARQVASSRESLREKVEKLEKFNQTAVGRELKMRELKERLAQAEEELKVKRANQDG